MRIFALWESFPSAYSGSVWTCNAHTWPLGGSVDTGIACGFDEAKTATKKLGEEGPSLLFVRRMTDRNNATSLEEASVT